jgi:hypothetical protein
MPNNSANAARPAKLRAKMMPNNSIYRVLSVKRAFILTFRALVDAP